MQCQTALSCLMLAVLGTLSCAASAAPTYTITPLGTLGSSNDDDIVKSGGLNNSGQVVGWGKASNGADMAYLASGGKTTNLNPPGALTSRATGINDAGIISATVTHGNDYTDHATRIQNGVATDLGTLAGGLYSYADGLNDSGGVVGDAYTSDTYAHAFVYENGKMVDLGTMGASKAMPSTSTTRATWSAVPRPTTLSATPTTPPSCTPAARWST